MVRFGKNQHQVRWHLAAPIFVAALCVGASPAAAQQLRYTPTNPHFGGSPFNGPDLMASAAAQRVTRAPRTGTGIGATNSLVNSFVSNLESRVSSQLSQYVTSQIFSQTTAATRSGTFTLSNLNVAYTRVGSEVNMIVTDVRTGETANVTYPLNVFVP